MKTYSESIMRKVRQYLDLDATDTSMDIEIMKLPKDAIFDYVCEWEGLINYSNTIRGWVKSIYEVEL